MKKNKKASILIYILVLAMITMFLGTIIFQNSNTLMNYKEIENMDVVLAEGIYYKGKLAFKYEKKLNSNGSGYIDEISCPIVTMSGSILKRDNLLTNLVYSTGAYCSGSYLGDAFEISFDNNYLTFSGSTYKNEIKTLVDVGGGDVQAQFTDPDNTNIYFNENNLNGIDDIDDNFNSDNYRVNSTGAVIGGVDYPNNFADDDVEARKIVYSYIYPEAGLTNVFWNNLKTNKIIEENTNNNDSINIKIGEVENGILHFDIVEKVNMKIVKFSRTKFKEKGELIALQSYHYTSTGGEIGYLQNNGGTLSFSDNSTANDFIFDFKNNDYGIFIKNNSEETIFYKIRGVDKDTGKSIYLVPIDDSDDIIIKYLGTNIVNVADDYIYKMLELVDLK